MQNFAELQNTPPFVIIQNGEWTEKEAKGECCQGFEIDF